ncbi:epithelial cell-transforming sequence 2 oncogene-like isoform X3 [Pygocentrus nattereri]|uniref:epithelial cell-transforming sequence 2 oncogene-like isoform X3 n=1 Tax=Pygocentrus nattereri TaxID=42514 RepID=UPI0008148188|nr:epithelial cell-transforming sequence 2 oncogene-like isoform X3 [Pygocentrus nattereri]
MTSVEWRALQPGSRSGPHSIKQWQLDGIEHTPFSAEESRSGATTTRFSAWTPVTNKSSNQQERTTLILHWFDLWTDKQRKYVLHQLLRRCSKSQLKFISDYFMEAVPITRLDFTTVLPRFLSIYILSFLNPMDLCAAAQVCWHWRFLAEQDCLWSPKCIRRGWFLPYNPSDNEYGAWKKHYVACAGSLDFLSPHEAADIYGTLNESLTEPEEQKERKTEHIIRQTIRETIVEHKRADLKNRRAWLANSLSGDTYGSSVRQKSSMLPLSLRTTVLQLGDKYRLENISSMKEHRAQLNSILNLTVEKTWATSSMKTLPVSLPLKSQTRSSDHPPVHLLLVSSRIPAYELVLCGALVHVLPLLYDYSGMTLEALLSLVERAMEGRTVQSIGIMTEGSTEEICLIEGLSITEKTVLKPCVREFWERLCGWVVPASEAGTLDIFAPLAASVAGVELISILASLSGLNVRAPTGICTGSYQHILSDWSGKGDFPPLLYLREGPLLSWCTQAEWIEQSLVNLRNQLVPQLQLLSEESRGRTLGLFLWDHITLPLFTLKSEVTQVLIEGLVALLKEKSDNPLEFLGTFLLKICADGTVKKHNLITVTKSVPYRLPGSIPVVPEGLLSDADWRDAVCRELLKSERAYVRLLQAIHTVYYIPLRAALDSNRAIISSANLLMLFSPLLDILECNNIFLQDLTEKMEEWSPLQCVGDTWVRFCTKLRAYTNFFNNYPTAIRTIDKVDKCREMLPAFRAFLKRHNRTLATRMLSIQELFLSPSLRVEEYVTLLEALMLHTPPEHPDHTHLSSAFNTLVNYRSFIRKLKKSSDRDLKLLEAQRTIQSCPTLQEGGRYLITTQDIALLNCLNEDIVPSLRMYECVSELGLFLFNDALVLTERRVSHMPFRLAVNTSHTFLASIALHSLNLSEIVDTKYVQNAFRLESPKRQWICATDREEDKIRWLGALRSAINAAKHN